MQQQRHPEQPVFLCSTFNGFKSTVAHALGITQIILGALLIIFNAIAIRYSRGDDDLKTYSIVAYGIWGGGLILIAGILEVSAGARPWKSMVVAYVVMTFIGIGCAIIVIVLGIITADLHGDNLVTCHEDARGCDWRQVRIIISMNALMVIDAFVELFVAAYSVVIGFQVCCCYTDINDVHRPDTSMQAANISYNSSVLGPSHLEAGLKKEEPMAGQSNVAYSNVGQSG